MVQFDPMGIHYPDLCAPPITASQFLRFLSWLSARAKNKGNNGGIVVVPVFCPASFTSDKGLSLSSSLGILKAGGFTLLSWDPAEDEVIMIGASSVTHFSAGQDHKVFSWNDPDANSVLINTANAVFDYPYSDFNAALLGTGTVGDKYQTLWVGWIGL
jgi:hypothetical protein